MKIYIASSFSLLDDIESLVYQLELEGHEICVKWWTRIELKHKFAPLEPDTFYNEPECKYAFERDLQGIKDCDCLIFYADHDNERKYTGASVEIGIAIALNKPVYSLGRIQNSAMYYPLIRCKNRYELFKNLNILKNGGSME